MKLKQLVVKMAAVAGLAVVAATSYAAPIETGDLVNIRLGGDEKPSTDTWAPSNYFMKVGGTVVYGQSKDPTAGLFDLEVEHAGQGDWQRLLTFCLEPGVPFAANNPFVAVDNVSNDVRKLWGTYFGDVDSDEKAAAFQVALWEIVADAGNYDLGAGNFQLVDPTGAVGQQAAAYLTGWNAWARLLRLQDLGATGRGGSQDLLIEVPVPGTLGLLVVGLAGLTAVRRKKEA